MNYITEIIFQLLFFHWMNYFRFNPLTSTGERVFVFIYPYLISWAPVQGEAKGLINDNDINS